MEFQSGGRLPTPLQAEKNCNKATTTHFTRVHVDEMFKEVVALSNDSLQPKISEIYERLWNAITNPCP